MVLNVVADGIIGIFDDEARASAGFALLKERPRPPLMGQLHNPKI